MTDAGNYAGAMWPLGADQLHVINENLQQLVKFLDSGTDLIFSLITTDSLTSRQISAIKCISDINDRNAKLLEMLTRRGVEHFNQFLECLGKFQRHLLPFLTGETGMANVPPYVVKFDKRLNTSVIGQQKTAGYAAGIFCFFKLTYTWFYD